MHKLEKLGKIVILKNTIANANMSPTLHCVETNVRNFSVCVCVGVRGGGGTSASRFGIFICSPFFA